MRQASALQLSTVPDSHSLLPPPRNHKTRIRMEHMAPSQRPLLLEEEAGRYLAVTEIHIPNSRPDSIFPCEHRTPVVAPTSPQILQLDGRPSFFSILQLPLPRLSASGPLLKGPTLISPLHQRTTDPRSTTSLGVTRCKRVYLLVISGLDSSQARRSRLSRSQNIQL